jgi:ADP-ribosylglycohydrolase
VARSATLWAHRSSFRASRRSTISSARRVTGYAPAYGKLGAITDDTQMTLFTAEGLIRAKARFEDHGICNVPWIVHQAYCRWLITQGGPDLRDPDFPGTAGWLITNRGLHARRAPGTTCLSALESGKRGLPDQPLNQSKGCGAVMRMAPVGLAGEDIDAFELGVELAALTHGHPSGYIAAGAFAEIIHRLTRGASLLNAIHETRTRLTDTADAGETLSAIDRAVALPGDGSPGPERLESLGGGWVAEEALSIGLYCALVAADVRGGLLLAVNHSGDSDSTGSIAGNLLGAIHGIQRLPDDLLNDLECRDLITQVADDFAGAFVDHRLPTRDRYPSY